MRLLLPLLALLLLVPLAPVPADAGVIREPTLREPTRDPRDALPGGLVREADDLTLRSAPPALTTDGSPDDTGRIDLEGAAQDPAATVSPDPFTPTTPLGLLLPGEPVPEPAATALLALAGLALALRRRR